jgi:RNA polymerase sigma-70 factor (ECF subfamily)
VSDLELVARARQGDHAAFGALVDRHGTAVYRAALAALGSHADAEDAAQDAFVAAFRRLDQFRGEASFKTWLLTIAWRQAINRRRARRWWWRRFAPPEDGKPSAEPASADPTPEESMGERQLRAAIGRAIDGLRPVLRDTLLLVQSGEHTYEEIGSMLGVPTGTIKWRVSEARRRIRITLRGQGYADV